LELVPLPLILTAIVLYRLNPADSVAFRSFHEALMQAPELRSIYRLHVFDNSPEPHRVDSEVVDDYVHDGTNPGLAKPYNIALQRARAAGVPWLMVLDQDTGVTLSYLQEASRLASEKISATNIPALVPKLLQDGAVASPHSLLGIRNTQPISPHMVGVAPQELHAFNSGAVLRVQSLDAIQGFPMHYPLDFLDHATFRKLQRQHVPQRLFIMASCLDHDLSLEEIMRSRERDVPARMSQVFSTEARFYREMGDPSERLLRRLRLLYFAAKNLRIGSFRRAKMFIALACSLR
jgi:hypothetical protein